MHHYWDLEEDKAEKDMSLRKKKSSKIKTSELINTCSESAKKISFAKISRQTLFKMTTRTCVLEKVSFTQLFNSINFKKSFKFAKRKCFKKFAKKESKGGLCM